MKWLLKPSKKCEGCDYYITECGLEGVLHICEAEKCIYGCGEERNRPTIVLTAERTTIPASMMWTVRRYGIIAIGAGKNSPSMTKHGITISLIEPGRASRGRTRHRLKPFSKCKVPMAGYYTLDQ